MTNEEEKITEVRKNPVILRMRLVLGGLLLEMMIGAEEFVLPTIVLSASTILVFTLPTKYRNFLTRFNTFTL